jgi:peptidoglycan/LPS O-acetylase OafA/YrhL
LKTLAKSILAYCGIAAIMRGLAYRYLPNIDVGYKLWGNADWLLLGALVAVSLRAGYLNRRNIKRWTQGVGGLGVAMLPIPVYIDLVGTRTGWLTDLLMPLYRVPFVLIYLSMLLYVILRHSRDNGENHKGVIFRFFAFLGYVSYGLYLVHPFVYRTIDAWSNRTWLGNVTATPSVLIISFSINAAASIAIAFLSRRYFEELFLRLKNRRSKRAPATV